VNEVLVIRGDDLPAGETVRVQIIHSGLEEDKQYDLVVSGRGLWLRFVGKRKLSLPPLRQRTQHMKLNL
jgi:hypothetical protein